MNSSQRNQYLKEQAAQLVSGETFSFLENQSDQDLRELFDWLAKFGAQSHSHPVADRLLSIIVYELNGRENRSTFRQMRNLTWIAIGLAGLQILIALFDRLFPSA